MTRTTAQSLSATDVSTSPTLLELLPRFHRHLAAENKAAKTITPHTDAVNRLNVYLAAQRMPTRLANQA
jgi:hypothetical protein